MLICFNSFVSKAVDVPCFTPSAYKACIPATITVDASCATNTSGSIPLYNYDAGNGGSYSTATSHTYTKPGTYIIRQVLADISNPTDRTIVIVDSPQPSFTLTSCINNSINVNITDAIYDKFIIDFGDGSPTQTVLPASTTNHLYAVSKSQNIKVTGVFNPNTPCGSSTQSIFSITNIIKPDIIDLTVLSQNTSGGSIQIRFNGLSGQKYRVERSTNSGAFTPVTSLTGSGVLSYTDANLNTQTNLYTYQVVGYDDCADPEQTSDIIYSIIINATASPGTNSVNWNSSSTVNSFTLTKNGTVQSLTTPASTSYTDTDIVCGANYCYQTTASLINNTASGSPEKSYSASVCVTGLAGGSGPLAITNINSTINNNASEISWDVPASISTYTLYQSVNGSTFKSVAQPASTPFSYPISNPSDNYCFQIDYKDKCNRQAPMSGNTCPVTLKNSLLDNVITLNWTNYVGFNNTGVQSYVVQKLDENGNVISETNVGTNTTYTETVNFNQPYLDYRIKVIPQNNTYSESYSNNVIFKFEAQLFIPDIFTPNGDGVNDTFIIKSQFINTYSISIFNRWGQVVYVSNNITEGWDGMNNNVYAVDGAYTYKITATDVKNNSFTRTGTVTLSR